MKTSVEKEVSNLTSNAEQIKNDDRKVFGAQWMIGDCSAQGDVLIVCIASLPKSAKPRKNRQMADGNTMGSRHIVEGGKCYDADKSEVARLIREATGVSIGEQYIGPVFTGPCELDHPEHGAQAWTGECVNAVVIQRVFDVEQAAERRARD